MINNNYVFNLNSRVHKPNVTRGGNSTGNVRRVRDTRSTEKNGFSEYRRLMSNPYYGQSVDYTVSSSNQVKKMIKTKKKAFLLNSIIMC